MNPFNINSKQFSSKNFKGVISLFAGNGISKGILIIGGLILAKYYGAANFGIYGVFLSYVAILPALSNLELNNIAIMQRDIGNVRNVFSASLWTTFFITSIIVFIIYFLKKAGIINLELDDFVLLLCGIGGVISGWNVSQNTLFTKYRIFKQIATSVVVGSVFSVSAQFIFFFVGWKESGLIYGAIIGMIATFLFNLNVSKERWDKVKIPSLLASAKENINIVKYVYPSTAIDAIANNILAILLLAFFTKPEVGVYAMAIKVLGTPQDIINSSISQVYFPKAVSLYHYSKAQLYRLTRKVSTAGFLLTLVYLILINTIGIYFLELILSGSQWSGLRESLLILSIWILTRSLLYPIYAVMVVIDKTRYLLWFNILLFLINLISVYFGVMYQSFTVCLYIFAISSAAGYFIQWAGVMYDLKKLEQNEG